jgi:hypothetical protein
VERLGFRGTSHFAEVGESRRPEASRELNEVAVVSRTCEPAAVAVRRKIPVEIDATAHGCISAWA